METTAKGISPFRDGFEVSAPAGRGRNRATARGRPRHPRPGADRRVDGTNERLDGTGRQAPSYSERASSSAASRSAGSGDETSSCSPVSGWAKRAGARAGTGARGRDPRPRRTPESPADGQADRLEMDADLVRPARLEPDLEQRMVAQQLMDSNHVTASRAVSPCRANGASDSCRSRPIGASIRPDRDRGAPRTSAR